MERLQDACVLLFSGGRDSTLAAVRISQRFGRLILVTITSDHLVGMDSVYQRLRELKQHLSPSTRWVHLLQPPSMPGDLLFQAPTCLPCHRSYTALGITVAQRFNAKTLAFGYARYQADWPEQTPLAIQRLQSTLTSQGINLLLPVYDITQKDEAKKELKKYNLSTSALEQKCLRQQFNVALEPSQLSQELAVWEQSLIKTLAVLSSVQIETCAEAILGELSD